jgi:hypothetical protein
MDNEFICRGVGNTVEEYNSGISENVKLKGKLPTTLGEMRTVMNK